MPVAFAWTRGDLLYWMQLPCEDQHHTHRHEIASATAYFDRDAAFVVDEGDISLYFAPPNEWDGYDVDMEGDAIHRAKLAVAVSTKRGRKRIAAFLMDTVGDVPDVLKQ